MTSKEQNIAFLHQYIKARRVAPFIAEYAESNIIERLQRLGGIAGTWRTDYSECTYCHPQRVNGVLVDLSTVENIRSCFEGMAA